MCFSRWSVSSKNTPEIKNAIVAADKDAQYDESAKRLLSQKNGFSPLQIAVAIDKKEEDIKAIIQENESVLV